MCILSLIDNQQDSDRRTGTHSKIFATVLSLRKKKQRFLCRLWESWLPPSCYICIRGGTIPGVNGFTDFKLKNIFYRWINISFEKCQRPFYNHESVSLISTDCGTIIILIWRTLPMNAYKNSCAPIINIYILNYMVHMEICYWGIHE